MRPNPLLLVCALGGCVASTETPPVDPAEREQAVVYGDDDRLEYYEHPSDELRAITAGSIAAMVSARQIDMRDPSDVVVSGQSLGDSYSLCSDEPFYDQPTAASCSGTLIDDDLILTAGHCVQGGCSDRWVFNYYYESEDQLATITGEDIYQCADVVVESTSGWGGGGGADYAIVQLDRAATPRHTPVPFNTAQWPVAEGDSLWMVGFGSGLPAKLDDGGVVKDDGRRGTQNAFSGTVDAFGGNSGSGVFDTNGSVVGILVAGATDYERSGGCYRVATLPESSDGETITYAILALTDLCESGWPSERLCGVESTCGDGVCAFNEDFDSCPDDCDAVATAPDGWVCDPAYYAAGDDCDCRCGIYDPDCDDPSLRVLNCRRNQVCGSDGTCENPPPDPPAVPDGWACDEASYDAGDGCDCDCGAYDPDCEDPSQQLYNCGPGQTCVEPGICVSRTTDPEDAGTDAGADAGNTDTSTTPDTGSPDGDAADVPQGEVSASGRSATGCAAAPGEASPFGLGVSLGLGLVTLARRRGRRA
ncbi:MAG: trypsin-like peptidase domain-containing protein [Myxococcales bacterium]|nr:trypsin-like peptidase domain-containing protein [Myxococcales bacterium]MCB9519691.1 trypsin-like peptidase domain-containing protein [Myxococcales bacterium]MCB9530381.1 trypsin-like peptidase domain-containing protein [Myxococcales bacterium]